MTIPEPVQLNYFLYFCSKCSPMKKGIILLTLITLIACREQRIQYPFQDPSLSFEERVDDLVSRMTLEQKVSQLVNDAPAIDTFGIPAYNWWSECLHGVARAGVATVFPQAIGLGATWDEEHVLKIATAISDEARAKHHEFIREGQRGQNQGLTFWSPNVNIFRDPRWGRGQETYGEDPYLTSRLGVAFVRGLQGDNPKYLKLVATPKHYAVHSGPEPLRHVFNADVPDRDLWDTYLPAFKATVMEGKAYSIMCAYNRFREKACCGSDFMLDDILRKRWGFEGYVVSDCGAINDIYMTHKITADASGASAIGVKAGCDLECGSDYLSLVEAVRKGLIQEEEINISLRRLLLARFKLGMFDPPERVPYAQIPLSVNDCPEHRRLSILAAQKSIVLLKNENHTLPLSKNLSAILVTGPTAENLDVLLGNYNGYPSKYVTVLQGIKNKVGSHTRILYEPGCGLVDQIPLEPVPSEYFILPEGSSGGKGLKAEYFADTSLSGKPVLTKTVERINETWDYASPAEGLPADFFSVRWSGYLTPPVSGDYILTVTGDDGYRLSIDRKKVMENWDIHAPESMNTRIKMEKGKRYALVLEYFEAAGGATIQLAWSMPENDPYKKVLDAAEKADVIVMTGGISPTLEGEEMGINMEGFKGGDRTDIELPKVQRDLLKVLKKTGKPIVLVLLNGSALGLVWEDENIPAILEGWYPGQEGGTALADVLFGDYNPAGRLPVTFYRTVKDLPPFEEYAMKGRTYRYFTGIPLYPFGYGLSYTTFAYSALSLEKAVLHPGDSTEISFQITNTGSVDGDEVVQLYLRYPESFEKRPLKELKAFKRIPVKSGEKKEIAFVISPGMLARYDYEKDIQVVEPGKYGFLVGSSSADCQLVELTIIP
jgi:beta-glucosidase